MGQTRQQEELKASRTIQAKKPAGRTTLLEQRNPPTVEGNVQHVHTKRPLSSFINGPLLTPPHLEYRALETLGRGMLPGLLEWYFKGCVESIEDKDSTKKPCVHVKGGRQSRWVR